MFFLLLILALANALVAGCSAAAEPTFPMADLHTLPHEVRAAPAAVQDAYRFAVANPDVLQHLPCYCGCGSMGHTSNYDCYIAGQDAAPRSPLAPAGDERGSAPGTSGALEFDSHALGCSICVDITLDAMRLLKEGKTVPEIKAYVDATYARYGPSNMP